MYDDDPKGPMSRRSHPDSHNIESDDEESDGTGGMRRVTRYRDGSFTIHHGGPVGDSHHGGDRDDW